MHRKLHYRKISKNVKVLSNFHNNFLCTLIVLYVHICRFVDCTFALVLYLLCTLTACTRSLMLHANSLLMSLTHYRLPLSVLICMMITDPRASLS